MLVGLSAMTAVAVTGGGTAEDPVPATPDAPPAQQEPYVPPEPEPEPLAGVLHYTIYNDTFDDSGVPLILAEGTVDMAALSDTPLALPQPETPSDGSYAFLGWAMGITTTCVGAITGGSTRPWLSLWVIMMAPIRRVLTPQLVSCAYFCVPYLSRYLISNGSEKFVPKLWLVPLCSALPSCIIASTDYVARAPANFSFSLF